MRPVRIDPASLRSLVQAMKSMQRDLEGKQKTRELPVWLPSGEPIVTLDQMAAMLNTDTKVAALRVIESGMGGDLGKEAKDVVAGMPGLRSTVRGGAPEIIERPGVHRRRRRRRRATMTEVKG